MRQFISKTLKRLEKLSIDQIREILISSSGEIERLETVIDSLPRGILVCDISHRLILANKSARRFLSIAPNEQSKEFVWNLVQKEAVSEFLADTILATDKAEEKEFSVDGGGTERLLSVSVMPLVQEQKIQGSLILIDDISDRKAREALMRRMESLASLTTLAAGVAHEIKNPLGSLSIHVQLIQKAIEAQKLLCPQISKEPEFHEKVDRYLNIVNEEVDRLNAIVVDFLFAVRPMNVELKKGDINAFIEELAEFVLPELKEKKINFSLNLEENIPLTDFDPALMKQALLNLIKNAADAVKAGGKLAVNTVYSDGKIIISVCDTGTGISQENLIKIFDPYFTTKDNGTGLGLTVVFKIIKEHQGEIKVDSKEGEGSIFSIILPVPDLSRKMIPFITESQ